MEETNTDQRDVLLALWYDVFGVNDFYDFNPTTTDNGTKHIAVGMNVHSLKTNQPEDFVLCFTEEDVCRFVESFLMEHHDLYVNYLVNNLKIEEK